MPKVNYVPEKKAPEINWTKALFLERKAAFNLNFNELSEKTGIQKPRLQRMFSTDPWDWKLDERNAVCKVFGISPQLLHSTVFLGK